MAQDSGAGTRTGRAGDEVGRRLTAKGRATRARVVAAAAELVFEHGVGRTSVEDVQQRAGVSASQLYHYFSGKDALVRAVIDHQSDGVLAVQQPLLGSLDSFPALEAWRDLLVDLQERRHCTGGCPIGSISAELADDDAEARARVQDGFARWEEPLREGLGRMRERGVLRADTDVDALALALLVAVQGGLVLTQARRDTTPLRTGIDTVLAQVRSHATADR
ncbi:TetR/AcrR family transcriptional regulator [Rhodococcus aerolatus]